MAVDVDRLRKECVYEAEAPLEALADDLAQIESLAAQWLAARRRLFLAGTIAIAAGCIGLAVFYPVGLVLVAAGIFLFVRTKNSPKALASKVGRCELLKSVAAMLALDTEPGTTATVRLKGSGRKRCCGVRPEPRQDAR